MILPHEISMIQRDYSAFTHGLSSCLITVHYLDPYGTKDEYGKYASEIARAIKTTGVVQVAQQRADRATDVDKKGTADEQAADFIVFLPTNIDLKGKIGVWFEVPSMCDLVPESKPPLAAHPHVDWTPNGQKMQLGMRCTRKH